MRFVLRVWSGVAFLVIATVLPAAMAQSEQLEAAIDLFEQKDYVAAQEALNQIDRDALSELERARVDALLEIVPEAIRGQEKALQDLATADEAYEAGDWDAADQLYGAVFLNEYATVAMQERAEVQRARIAEKKGLAEAARPEAAVEEEPAEEPVPPPPPAEPVAVEEEPVVEPEPMTEVMPAPVVEQPRRLTPTDEMRIRDELFWQRAVARAQAAAESARGAAGEHRYDEARQLVAAALQAVDAARRYAEPVSKYQDVRNGIVKLRDQIEGQSRDYQRRMAAEERKQIAERIEARGRLIAEQKAEKIEQLFNSAAQLRREQRFSEAAVVLREILRIDPGNAKARYQLDVTEDYESFKRQDEWQHNVYSQQRSALVNAEEALIPWDHDILYPKNWEEIIRRREGMALGTGRNLEDIELNRKLEENLGDVRFEEQPFDQVKEFLEEITGLNLTVDWSDLENNGITRDAPVSLRLKEVSTRFVLDEILRQVGGEVRLAYSAREGVVRIATKERLDQITKETVIYDIRDLLINIPSASRMAAFDVTQGLGQQGGGGGGGSSGMFGQNQNQGQRQGQDNQNVGNEDLVGRIIDIIQSTVEPDSWIETGGGDGRIRELNGQLVIYNTSDAHRQVAGLLKDLRETSALQISVEARFLNVVANFLEQFGVDLDFVLNSGSAGYDRVLAADGSALTDPFTGAPVLVSRQYSRIGSYASVPGIGTPFTPGAVPNQPYGQAAFVPTGTGVSPHFGDMTPISAQQGSFSLVDPGNLTTGVPGSFTEQASFSPALNIAGSFLDNLQVDFLIRATQANSRSSIVQAPRLVLFNGQASSISVGRSRSYVASLEPRLAEGAVGFEPEVETADSGVNLWVEGTISADRKYVTMTVDVQQRDEPDLIRFEVQRASGSSPGSFIQLPDYSFAILTTTVSVPDGGTVLLGGLKQVGEVEIEAGVPILNKIPILKRAFTNKTTVKDTRTLLILVKAKIIIREEAEEEAFPSFSRGI